LAESELTIKKTGGQAMTKVHVTAKRDFLASLTAARPLVALAELVWNGFDAQSDRVEINLDLNDMDGLQNIRVHDYGSGIDFANVQTLFGSLGDSWKKNRSRLNGRAIHGKTGKGRFKAFALGQIIEWNTTFQADGKYYSYRITGNALSLDDFDISEPVVANVNSTGTEVLISNVQHEFPSLLGDRVQLELAKVFAVYLTEYPELTLQYNGIVVDPKSVQESRDDYHLGDIELGDGRKTPVAVSVIEWRIPTDRVLHLCDASGISLLETEVGPQVRAPGFDFTAYIKTDHFRELDKKSQLILDELHPDVATILRVGKGKIREHFRRRLAEDQSKIVERWKQEQIYPYEDKMTLTTIETVERQVFDILAVNVQSYLPSFEDADTKSKQFTFRLLAQALRENPDSVQEIVGEVLGLKKEAQDDLAELLRKTPLSSIISSAKIVANRLDFLIALETLLFDKEMKRNLLERDQLHKILEREAWLFREEFSLAGSEQRLEEVLQKHLDKLGSREDDPDPVRLSDGKTGRVDLMFHKVVQPRNGEYDYLIVELKRPSKKVDDEVLTQVKKYAIAVATDERFRDVPANWTFVAISNELDDYAKREANQRGQQKGKVFDDAQFNITVWAKSWAEVINDARARLRFFNDQLAYEADRDTAKAYLKKTHEKFIPKAESTVMGEPE
jgi:hypothetical protein